MQVLMILSSINIQGYITLTAHFIDAGWKFENVDTGMATHEVHSSFIQHHEICKLVLRNHFKFVCVMYTVWPFH